MRKHEMTSSLVWMTVGVLFLAGAISLGLGSTSEPGAGFFPFVMAASLIVFSLIHFVSSFAKGRPFDSRADESLWPKSDGIKRILLTIVFLLGFIFALNYLGFVLTTLIFMLLSLKYVEPQRWRTVFVIGCLATVLSYSIFQLWLRSNLPIGFLGF